MPACIRRWPSPTELCIARSEELARTYLGEYEEEGEVTYLIEEEIDVKTARRLLSPKLFTLMQAMKRGAYDISTLAKMLDRSVPNVYNDIKYLHRLGLVYLQRDGKRVIPQLLLREIVVEI